jgi:5'-3' exonuclease
LVLITGDKDLAQLIHAGDLWWEFGKDKRMDARGIQKRFGVRPDQIADQLAIAGDKVDNIPGVPGVGMATAASLLRKFDSIEVLLSRIPEIASMKVRGAKRLMGLIDEHQDTIRIARQLTGIHLEADLPAGLKLEPQPPEQSAFDAICDELDMSPERRARWERLLAELHGG